MANNNLYNYKTPKSGNEETGFFNVKGRINRKSFFLRWLFTISLYLISSFLYFEGFWGDYNSRTFIFFETIHIYFLPLFLLIFNLIQGAKRMHDVNKSGWYFLAPFYNLYLIFSPGTKGNNDYGIDPTPSKNIQFFDEIEPSIQNENHTSNAKENKSGLEKWREHLNQVSKKNPNKTYQEILEIARNTYNSNKPANNPTSETPKKKSNNYLLLLTIVVAAAIYYFNYYEPNHRDSDNDGIANIIDECPYDYGKVSGCPDNDNDGVADKNDSCADVYGNEDDGCFYYKRVTFSNNSSNKAYLCVAYKHNNDWICEGWFSILAGESYIYQLPKHFKGKEVFWYANDENDNEWSGSNRYFYIAKGGSTGFEVRNGRFIKKGGGRAIKKGFYKLSLTDENTSQGFKN
jgi:uncharacterized membrane protein YhaH (DUF805 family)